MHPQIESKKDARVSTAETQNYKNIVMLKHTLEEGGRGCSAKAEIASENHLRPCRQVCVIQNPELPPLELGLRAFLRVSDGGETIAVPI